MTPDSKQTFLSLVRQGIGNDAVIPDVVDWQAIKTLADKQGLAAVIVDGIEKLPDTNRPPKELLLQWIGEVMQNYENYYELYRRTIAELARWYNAHGYKMMVLKGYACSIDWPKPEHRPCGDIDIWLFGRQKEADRLLASDMDINVDNSHHHHTVFNWMGFTVENHYDFVNVHAHKLSREMDKLMKDFGMDDSHNMQVLGKRIHLPSSNLHALFLLRHSMAHFASERITLRHLLDWAFFVKKHGKEVDWRWLIGILERFGMRRLFDIFNAICIEDLGFESNIFPPLEEVDGSIKGRVLSEILTPEFNEKEPNTFLPRVLFKYRRWCANEWKHQLCYKESMWNAFWSGVWSHLQKPHSI